MIALVCCIFSWLQGISRTFSKFFQVIDIDRGEVFHGGVVTIFAAFTDTQLGTYDTTLVALTIFLLTARLLAMAAFLVVAFLHLNLWLKSYRVPVNDSINSHLPFFVAFKV